MTDTDYYFHIKHRIIGKDEKGYYMWNLYRRTLTKQSIKNILKHSGNVIDSSLKEEILKKLTEV
ncbi:MAG: hypothetical protein M1576_04140 [Deltaproteobacteria bacterium]|nr:hypothetical protein [Deltaproteobacteria bacterium]